MVRRSVPASSRCVAHVCRLCLWVHSRHYVPFLTMSSDFPGCLPSFDNGARETKRVDQSPDIVLLCFAASQAIEEPKQLVSWLIPPGLAARR
jgi:hypothetical protein